MSRDHDDSRRKFIHEVGAGALVLGAGAAGLGILDPSEALAAKKRQKSE